MNKLTDARINELAETLYWYDGDCERIDPVSFARAIEAEVLRINGPLRAYVPITDAELQDPEYMRAYVEEMQAVITDLITSPPQQQQTELRAEKVALTAEQLRIGVSEIKRVLCRGMSPVHLPADSWIEQALVAAVNGSFGLGPAHETTHSCSYHCERPECIKQQRDELRRMVEHLPHEAKADEVQRGWQPIETAPKNGVEILATGFNNNDPAAGRHTVVAFWSADGEFVQWGENDRHLSLEYLTHWMPLPAAPAAPKAQETGE